jgi:hypothetical protein
MEPAIKPNTWILFRVNTQSLCMGQVAGAFWAADDKGGHWSYNIPNPAAGGTPYFVSEPDIYKLLDGDTWVATEVAEA